MSEEMLMTLYVKITNKIDGLTRAAHEGVKINKSIYNIMHQAKYEVMRQQREKGVI